MEQKSYNRDTRQTRFAILGAGALGGFYGAMLHRAGHEVNFLLHSDLDVVRREGLRVRSAVHGDCDVVEPRAWGRVEDMPACDVVLVALKSTQNGLLAQLLPPVLAPGGCVLVMQNGLGVEDDAAAVVGAGRVVGGLAFLCSHKVGPGRIEHLDYGDVRLGEYGEGLAARGITDRLRRLGEDFAAAGVGVELEADLLLARWKKLVWNVPYNGLSVVLNATTDRLMGDPATRELCERLMREVVAGAAATGRTIEPAFVEKMLRDTDKMVAYKPSMKLDYDAGRPMELEAIYGNPLRLAARHGAELPGLAMLYHQLRFLDARRVGGQPRH